MPVHVQESYGMKAGAQDFPMMVVLSFVYECNAGCPNCPYNNSSIRDNYKDALYMPEKLFKRIADECGPYHSLLRLSGGGEPMLHPQAVQLIEYAKSEGCKIGLITNGSAFDEAGLTRIIEAGIDAIEFSVDAGDSETYNWVRPGLDWDQLVKNVQMARSIRNQKKSDTRIICSIINQTGVDVEAAEKFWKDKVDKVQIRKFLTWGYNEDHSADPTPYLPPEKKIPCPWLFERLNIDSKGNVTLCGEDIAFNERFANVYNQTIKEIWHGEVFEDLRKKHLEHRGDEIAICSKCPDWQYRSWQYNYWKLLEEAESNNNGR